MIDDKPETAPRRRVHPVVRSLKPLLDRIGELNKATVFLVAFSERNADLPALASAIALNRARLSETLALLNNVASLLPAKYHRDTRLTDAATALDRITKAFDQVEGKFRGSGRTSSLVGSASNGAVEAARCSSECLA